MTSCVLFAVQTSKLTYQRSGNNGSQIKQLSKRRISSASWFCYKISSTRLLGLSSRTIWPASQRQLELGLLPRFPVAATSSRSTARRARWFLREFNKEMLQQLYQKAVLPQKYLSLKTVETFWTFTTSTWTRSFGQFEGVPQLVDGVYVADRIASVGGRGVGGVGHSLHLRIPSWQLYKKFKSKLRNSDNTSTNVVTDIIPGNFSWKKKRYFGGFESVQ